MSSPSALIRRERVPLTEKVAWNVDDVAAASGLSDRFVKDLAAKGFFRAYKIGRRTLFNPRQIVEALFSGLNPTADGEGTDE